MVLRQLGAIFRASDQSARSRWRSLKFKLSSQWVQILSEQAFSCIFWSQQPITKLQVISKIIAASKCVKKSCWNASASKSRRQKIISTQCDLLDGRPTTVHICLPKLPSQHYDCFGVLSSKKYEALLNPRIVIQHTSILYRLFFVSCNPKITLIFELNCKSVSL